MSINRLWIGAGALTLAVAACSEPGATPIEPQFSSTTPKCFSLQEEVLPMFPRFELRLRQASPISWSPITSLRSSYY